MLLQWPSTIDREVPTSSNVEAGSRITSDPGYSLRGYMSYLLAVVVVVVVFVFLLGIAVFLIG